jgi:hypothetical protein
MRNRIKRSELFRADGSPESSSRSASPITAEGDHEDWAVHADYGFEYDFITAESCAPEVAQVSLGTDASEEYQFRLFTSAPKPTIASQPDTSVTKPTIRLSPTPPPTALAESLSLDKAQFVRPNRPDHYYFTSAIPQETINALKAQYAAVAVSSSDVLVRAQSTNWPGAALPWRLIHVEFVNRVKPPSSTNKRILSSSVAQDVVHAGSRLGRKRPSKKRRISLRRRIALRAEMAAQASATQETEQEKRTRRNREKKVKRKEREKRKKLESEDGGKDEDMTGRETATEQGQNELGDGEEGMSSSSATEENSKGRTGGDVTTQPEPSPSGPTEHRNDEPALIPAKTAATSRATAAPTRRGPPTARARP